MTGRRIKLRRIREVLRLRFDCNLSLDKIVGSTKLSKGCVHKTLKRFEAASLKWPLVVNLTDIQLKNFLYPTKIKPDNCDIGFDVVFIDPPTFSNSKRMGESFDVQRDHVDLITDGLKALAPNGELIFTNNKRNFKMDFEAMNLLGVVVKSMSDLTRDKDFQRNKHIHNSWSITRDINSENK